MTTKRLERIYERELMPMNKKLENLICNLEYYNEGRGPPRYPTVYWLTTHDEGYEYSTNFICNLFFSSRREGMKIIREAEKAGYIRRDRIHIPGDINKRGRSYIIHSLTPKGKQLRDSLKKIRTG